MEGHQNRHEPLGDGVEILQRQGGVIKLAVKKFFVDDLIHQIFEPLMRGLFQRAAGRLDVASYAACGSDFVAPAETNVEWSLRNEKFRRVPASVVALFIYLQPSIAALLAARGDRSTGGRRSAADAPHRRRRSGDAVRADRADPHADA